MTHLILNSPDLHCGSCSESLYKVLDKIGVSNTSINILSSEIEIDFEDEITSTEKIINEIAKNGFKTTIVESYKY